MTAPSPSPSPSPPPALPNSSSTSPAVSVIMPVYNAAHFLPAALDGIFGQSFQDFEVILIDDGSTDDLEGALKPYEGRYTLLRQANAGPASARNRGIEASRGEFVAFLDSDDIWLPNKLEVQIAGLRAHPNSAASFSDWIYFDTDKSWESNLMPIPPPDKMFETLLTEHFIALSSLMVRRSCLNEVGLFDPSLIGCEDYNLYLRLARHYPFQFEDVPLVRMRCHPGNLSADLEQMSRDEIANLDKIAAMFPDLKLPRRRMIGQIWYRFGCYYFDEGKFGKARSAFGCAIAYNPTRLGAYPRWLAAALPPSVREGARDFVRRLRGTQRKTEAPRSIEGEPVTHAPIVKAAPAKPRAVMMVTWSLVAGGSESYALTLARHLERTQFAPMLCALDQGGALEPEIRRLKLPYFVMHRRPGVQLGVMWRLFRLFRRKRVRVVHTHHFNQLFYSFLGAKLVGARLIHTEHSVESYKKPRLCLALRLLARGCDRVTAIGEDGARVLRENVGIPASKLQIVRAGIDLDAFDTPRDEARRDMNLDADAPVALIVARLSSEKNHRNMLQAWAEVVQSLPQATLLIAGGGDEEATLKAEVERLNLGARVQMLGVRRDVARLLGACDVFVLSSDREGLPLVILEAFAAARPVVATLVGDLPLVVRDGESGLLVPPRDPGAMAKALGELLSDPDRARKMGEAGRASVQSYGLAPMLNAHAALYGESGGDA